MSIEFVKKWFTSNADLFPIIHYYPPQLNQDTTVWQIDLEKEDKISVLLIYDDGYIHIDLHDKVIIEPICIISSSFQNIKELGKILDDILLKNWGGKS